MADQDPLELSGRKVQVVLLQGRIVVGWIVAVTASHIHLAMDTAYLQVRLVPLLTVASWHIIEQGDDASIPPLMGAERHSISRQLHRHLSDDVIDSYRRLDVSRVTESAVVLRQIASRVFAASQQPELGRDTSLATLQQVRLTLIELERSELSEIVARNSERLGQVVHVETVPGPDAVPGAIDRVRQAVSKAESQGPRRVSVDAIELAEATRKSQKSSISPKIADGIGSILLGGALASGNTAIAGVSGAIGALPTLGVGAVAAALGAATSIYTGLTAIKDGIVKVLQDEENG